MQLLEDAERRTPYFEVAAGEALRVDAFFGNLSAMMPAVTLSRIDGI